jgi:hypothetical protein
MMIDQLPGRYCVFKENQTEGIPLFTHVNKVQALLEASRLNQTGIKTEILYHWNHRSFNNFNPYLLGKVSLEQLYKERAQQLRDKYDVLILYYSGGSDSHNVLQSFLKNNIKLDYVFVRWPSKMLDKGLYEPNTANRDASNFVSEWDYTLKPDLEYLRTHHPDIQIITDDWLDDADPEIYNDDIFATQNHMHSAVNFLRMQSYSVVEKQLLSQGKRVAQIWGIDKPQVCRNNLRNMFFFFRDDLINLAVPIKGHENNIEFFYWTPDMPLLAYEMAYQMYLYFKANPQLIPLLPYVRGRVMGNETNSHNGSSVRYHIAKQVCFPDWDFSRFQAEKPKMGPRKDKDFWFYSHNEFKPMVDRWEYYYRSQLDNINHDFLVLDDIGKPQAYKPISSPTYYLGSLD